MKQKYTYLKYMNYLNNLLYINYKYYLGNYKYKQIIF